LNIDDSVQGTLDVGAFLCLSTLEIRRFCFFAGTWHAYSRLCNELTTCFILAYNLQVSWK